MVPYIYTLYMPYEEEIKKLQKRWKLSWPSINKKLNPFVNYTDLIVYALDDNKIIIAGISTIFLNYTDAYTQMVTSLVKGTAHKIIAYRNKILKELKFKRIFSEAKSIDGYMLAKKIGAVYTGKITHVGPEMVINL